MSRINIPLDAFTSRLNLQDRMSAIRSQSFGQRFANLKPISEFFDFKRLSKPASFGDAQSRLNYNLGYFSSNYAVLLAMLAVYTLITNPLLTFVMVFVIIGMYIIGRLNGADLDLGFARFTTSQLYTGLVIIAVPIFIVAKPFATLLWLIGASSTTILGHAAFMDKPIESAFSEEAV